MSRQEILQVALKAFTGIDEEAFKLSHLIGMSGNIKKVNSITNTRMSANILDLY